MIHNHKFVIDYMRRGVKCDECGTSWANSYVYDILWQLQDQTSSSQCPHKWVMSGVKLLHCLNCRMERSMDPEDVHKAEGVQNERCCSCDNLIESEDINWRGRRSVESEEDNPGEHKFPFCSGCSVAFDVFPYKMLYHLFGDKVVDRWLI